MTHMDYCYDGFMVFFVISSDHCMEKNGIRILLNIFYTQKKKKMV